MRLTLCKLCLGHEKSKEGLDSLIGLYDRITVEQFPALAPELLLVTEVEADVSESGQPVRAEIRFIDEDGTELAKCELEGSAPVAVGDQPGRQLFPGRFEPSKVRIPRPGRYRFDVLLDGHLAGSEQLTFRSVTQQPAGQTDALAGVQLKPKEIEVLKLIAETRTNKEIASAMKLSEPMIKVYVSRLMMKLRCRNRIELALRARDVFP